MIIYLFNDDRLITFNLPVKKIGDFWITDNNGENIVNISSTDNEWLLSGSENTTITYNGEEVSNTILNTKEYYEIIKDDKKYILFATGMVDFSLNKYDVSNGEFTFKKDIVVSSKYLDNINFELKYNDNKWKLKKDDSSTIYLNDDKVIDNEISINYGDKISIYGLNIYCIFNSLIINDIFSNLRTSDKLKLTIINSNNEITNEEIINKNMYNESDYFLKSPRISRDIEEYNMKIDSPPKKQSDEEIPLIYTLGPMLTMGASSLVTITNALMQISSGERTFKQTWPTLIISICMLASMLLWPFLTKKYEKKRKIKREEERQDKYKAYLESKRNELFKVYDTQKRILEENLVSNDVCYDMILNKRRTLWSRKMEQNDFLTCRIGIGKVDLKSKISYQSEDFTMDDDNLKKMLESLINNFKYIDEVPIGYSFYDKNKTAINGLYPKYIDFTNNILLQLMSFYSYDELKFVVITNKKNQKRWSYLKESLYCFSNDKSIRFFATDSEEVIDVSTYLDQIFNNRRDLVKNVNEKATFDTYYFLIIDDIDLARKVGIVDDILNEKINLGFSLVVLEEKLSKLPSEIDSYITFGDKTSIILSNDSSEQIRFNDEISNKFDMEKCTYTLTNLPIYFNNSFKNLPDSISFLELRGVGQVEQLNALNKWKENDPTKSLKAEIGVNENGDLFILDLHEKFHGPHGLIAGSTGSGKSEFIITYVLSLAVNYSPEEVAFVLIDYKGGGLAGAFVNNETGLRLPHVVGTITNLDKTEINRALSSIKSELRRRQEKFNEVREVTNESTIDIYKYQKLYRDGVIDEPIPHLIIVCDEFAELKDQQPDFMEDLVSTARIGRSLGVHLILATQKPSGVVDAQIWSNSRFKVCLKVQDKQDSMEMIKRADAALLKNVGRFYLQVGYNEYFALGQSAYAGAPYFPNKEYKKPLDKNLYFINNVGSVVKSINNSIAKRIIKAEGEELSAVLNYIINISKTMNLKINNLWMDRIPNNIYINNLYKKYNYSKVNYNINPIIGEYDDPLNQVQGLLTLNLTTNGNTMIYGIADSGKDELLQTLVFSCLSMYGTNELNMYIVDFGAETLINFENAPQVGNVILNGEDEKLENLIKMLGSELLKRKKLFTSYNGNYLDYLKLSGRGLCNIIVVINSIEVMSEVYPDLIDRLTPIIREGSKYGITFVMTSVSQSSAKFKIVQSCKQFICLQMANETDYRDILGKTDGLVPSNNLGRGLIKLGKVCEFQTAFIDKIDNIYNRINELINNLKNNGISDARHIPTMPDIIKLDSFNEKYKGISSIPVGIYKDNLTSCLYDFSKNVTNIISSDEIENIRRFIMNFLRLLEINNTFNKMIVDSNNYFENFNYSLPFESNDMNSVIDKISLLDNKIQEILKENNMNVRSLKKVPNTMIVIIDFEKFMSKLDDEHKDKFKEILNNNKDTLKINFVFVDIPFGFKKYEYEEWYKNTMNNNNGIWIGSGVTNQFALKLTIQPSSINNIDNEYAVVIKKGMPSIIKVINEIKVEE